MFKSLLRWIYGTLMLSKTSKGGRKYAKHRGEQLETCGWYRKKIDRTGARDIPAAKRRKRGGGGNRKGGIENKNYQIEMECERCTEDQTT
jgi:hypothetical protein